MITYMQAHRHLMQYSIRPSVQRTAIMEYLMNHKTHPTVDEIYSALFPSIPTLSKTTVYNTLNLFLEKGAVRVLTLDEKNARFDADISQHAHFMCKSCGKVYDIHNLDNHYYQVPNLNGFKVQNLELSFHGICNACRES